MYTARQRTYHSPGRLVMKSVMFLAPVLLITSCTKLLHKEDISIGRIENYDQLLGAVAGVYGRMDRAVNLRTGFYGANLKGDDLCNYYGEYDFDTSTGQCFQPTAVPLDQFNRGNWSFLYDVIGSANNIIIQYNLSTTKDAATRALLGEIYLLRAYCYFRLTRTYGEIPLVDNINVSYSTPKASFIQIYQFIENDLKTAMTLLPDNNSTARIPYVTPHRGTAKAMLAEVYLSRAGYPLKDISKYTLAAKEAGEVIDSADYFGYALLNDFAWLWDRAHLYNSESEFSLYCSNTNDPEYPSITYYWNGFYYASDFAALFDWGSIVPGKEVFIQYYASGVKFYNDYPPEYRKEITFFTNLYHYYRTDSAGIRVYRDSLYSHMDRITSCSRIAYRKFYYDPEIISDSLVYVAYGNDETYYGLPRIYIFRYAMTLLTYAEAMARSGKPDAKAYECVNEIRRRAHHLDPYSPSAYDLQPGMPPEAFADSVVAERGRELAGEPEGRWFDLLRLDRVNELSDLLDPDEQVSPDVHLSEQYYFLFPPQGDVDLNPNLGE